MNLPENFLGSLKVKLFLLIFIPVGLFLALVYFYVLPVYESDIYGEKKTQVKQMVNSTMGILKHYHELEKKDVLSRQEAQDRAKDLIRKKRFGKGNLNYFWINDFRPVLIMHPYVPELKGQNLSGYEDPEGFRLFEAFVETCREDGSGFVEYHWQYYDEAGRIEPKISFVKGFEPWGWILGTGVYVHEVEGSVVRTRNNILWATGLIALGLLVAGYYFVRFNITAPLDKIMSVASGLARGNLEQDEIELDTSGELEELAEVFNKLIKNFKKMVRQARRVPPPAGFTGADQENRAVDFSQLEPESPGDELQELSKAFHVMSSSLRRTTTYLRGIINSMEEMLVVLGPEGLIREINSATFESLGYGKEELKGKQLQTIVDGIEDINLKEVLEQEGYRQREEKLKTKSGELIPVLISISELDLSEKNNNYVCVATDIERRKRIEDKLRRSEKQFRTLMNNAPVSILIHDKETGEIVDANPSAWERYGFDSLEEYKNNFDWENFPYSFDEALEKIHKTVEEGPQNFEWHIKSEEGQSRWEHIQLRTINIDGVERVMAAVTDITQLKEKEQELQAYTQQLEATEQQLRAEIEERENYEEKLKKSLNEKEILLKEVHHRVKNNLFTIVSILELQKFEKDDPEVKKMITEIINRIHSMALIHQEIYSKENMEAIDFDDYMRELVDSLVDNYVPPDKTIDISYELESTNPDLNQIIPCGLVVNEIVTNALQHGFDGRKEGTLKIKHSVEDENYRFEIANDGNPLPPEFNIENSSSIGLKLVRMLISKQLGGEVEINSNDWVVFKISFPVDRTTS